MSDIIAMQKLVGTVQGLKQSIQATKMYIAASSNNDVSLSNHQVRFAQIQKKYSEFAANFGVEIDEFLGLLSESIISEQLKQEQEKERLMEKAEIVSNTNHNSLEIEDNLTDIDYSSASSVANEQKIEPSEPKPVPVAIKSKPSKAAKTMIKNIKQSKKTTKIKKNKKVIRKNAVSSQQKPKPQPVPVQNEEYKEKEIVEERYEYNANRVRWSFKGEQRSSTIIFVGNLPNYIKVAAVQFFVMKKAKVTMRQIEETTLKQGARGKYALVRFRSDVLMNRINAFMNNVNNENNELFEKKKSDKTNNKSQKSESWQKRVFLKFNTTFKYYESEEDMYYDPKRQCSLFLRNFDILDKDCHQNLTYALLECGELAKDIEIKVDGFGDPYCIATFKDIDDAVYCCNAEIVFGGKVLEMRYAKF